jgi:hypothetical protein
MNDRPRTRPFPSRQAPGLIRRRRRFHPEPESLEGRRLLASIVVNNPTDTPVAGETDLRQAIAQANANGTYTDTQISFDPSVFAKPRTIALSAANGQLEVTSWVSIMGPAVGVTISGGGAVRVFQVGEKFGTRSAASMSGLTISGGSTSGLGGGVYVAYASTLDLSACTISGNSASTGGGIFDGTLADVTLTNCSLSGNSASTGGGMAVDQLAEATISGCAISNNNAFDGGGLYNHGAASLYSCTISGNISNLGGGVSDMKGATTTLGQCTVSGNQGGNDGGGLAILYGTTATLSDCTLSGNAAKYGGGVEDQGTVTLTDCTIAGNTGGYGGGLNFERGLLTIEGTIVAGNRAITTGPDVDGGVNSDKGYNLIGDASGSSSFNGPGDQLGSAAHPIDPRLTTPGDYGGPTPTMAPQANSPAVGRGAPLAGVTTDQRGVARPASHPDVGAFQTQSGAVVNTTIDGNTSPLGDVTLRQAVNLAAASAGTEAITFDPTVFATPRTIALSAGQIELTSTAGTQKITGPSAGVTISAGDNNRVFQIDEGVTASISGLTISGSTASYGGGIFNYGNLSLANSTVTHGYATKYGGGIMNTGTGTLTLTDCTISGNSAFNGGGLDDRGTATLTDCTISGNAARSYYSVGGMLVENSATATLSGCTISGNSAPSVGGLYNNSSSNLTIGDTIIGGNTSYKLPDFVLWVSHDVGYNLFGFGAITGATGPGERQVGVNPMLSPLGNYGGTTQTMVPLPGSPAIDSGNPGFTPSTATDQRGQPRVYNGRIDIGAVESQGYTLAAVAGSTPQSATVGTAFALPLAVTLTAKDGLDPVSGADVAFTANPSVGGASASFSTTAAVGSNGIASIAATADGVVGSYSVTASVSGVSATAVFGLTNTPGAAAAVSVISGSGQTTTVGTAFGAPLVVEVTDAYGNPVPGASVAFVAPASGASAALAGSPATTGPDGRASATPTADFVAGSYSVTASVAGVSAPAVFGLTNATGAAAAVSVVSGSGQSALIGAPFAAALLVEVADAYGNPVPGASVAFAAPASGATATLSSATAITGPDGEASITATAGIVAGPYSVTASVAGVATTADFALANTASVTTASVSWGTAGTAALSTAGDGLRLLPAGRSTDLPWYGISSLALTLSSPAPLAAGDVSVVGSVGGSYGPVTVSGSGSSYTITLARPIDAADRVTITLGNASIAAYTRRLDVLPGDVNDDGVVDSRDLVLVRNAFTGLGTVSIAPIFLDVNGDGVVDVNDYILVRKQVGTRLP